MDIFRAISVNGDGRIATLHFYAADGVTEDRMLEIATDAFVALRKQETPIPRVLDGVLAVQIREADDIRKCHLCRVMNETADRVRDAMEEDCEVHFLDILAFSAEPQEVWQGEEWGIG